MDKIRWGVAGPGIIARKFAEAIANVPSAELIAVASTSYERAGKFAEEFNVPHVFSSYEEMAKSDKIDAVYVSTAHPFHKPCAEIFIKNGKAVLCEKPLCVNEDEAKELISLAKEKGVFLMEAMWTRFLPFIKELRSIMASGEIGKPMSLTADFCYSIEREEDPKLFENSLAGGSLLVVGVYALHFADMVFEDVPEKISAVANVEDGVDYHTQILLGYREGKTAALSSAIKLQKPFDAYIYGTEGSIRIPDFYMADRFTIQKDGKERIIECPYSGNGFEGEILEVCRCMGEGRLESDINPHSKSVFVLEQMDEIRKQIGVSYICDKK
ncbi:MAG: Gfo/Idh/MocA family oxidoreductase [Ruminococcaceae bacterium]|nr:Gfo/Idh/MocA family oxidoreductase [Oscillospiraceae bacterium]